MPAAYVKPSVKRGKTDAVDADAICEAVTQPSTYSQTGDADITERAICAVIPKEQQALLTIHRLRQLVVRQKTRVLNLISGLLLEFGRVIRNGPIAAMRFIKTFQTEDCMDMPDAAKSMLKTLCDQGAVLDERMTFYDKHIGYHARIGAHAKRIRTVHAPLSFGPRA